MGLIMTLSSCKLKLLLSLFLFSCLKIFKCEDIVQSCCPSKYILGLGRDKSVRCVDSTNITSPLFMGRQMQFHWGPKKTNYSTWEKCNYELQPITIMNDRKDLFCVNELTFTNEWPLYGQPYLAGIRCKNDTVQKNRIMHGVNKCCKMGQMFSNNCTPLKSGMTNVIDQKINQGMMYAALDIYTLFFQNNSIWNWPNTIKVYEKPNSYFTSQEYIKDFPKGHPGDYCIEQSENASKIIVVTNTKCSNCIPQCYGFDTYLVAKPNSKEKFITRSITWNQNDTYNYMYNFEYFYLRRAIYSRFIRNNVCSKGVKKYETDMQKINGFMVNNLPYSHKYDTDICSDAIYDESLEESREFLFSCTNSSENW